MKYFKKDGKIKIKTIESPNKDELKKIKEDGWVECDFHGKAITKKEKVNDKNA